MNKVIIKHRGAKISIKEKEDCTDITVTMPNNKKYGKKLVDKRPDKEVSMTENPLLIAQLRATVDNLLQDDVIEGELN
jgi:hypothetical protein